jgi:hypothetical protein
MERAQGDAPAEEMLPTVVPVKEGSKRGVIDSLPKTEAQTALLPQQADAFAAGRTGDEKVQEAPPLTSDAAALDEEPAREGTPPREVTAVIQREALSTVVRRPWRGWCRRR